VFSLTTFYKKAFQD